ncbi:MAG: hypothetical protein C0623_00925 [Desulfuromonas sp.]|nr:MAG: hypothetical protein C0623_00925 [Desulfuromonas sp.]
MNWTEYLNENEQIRWQGRPAPRCYTFRNWIHSLFGVVIMIAAVAWSIHGLHLATAQGSFVFILLPIPFLLAGVYLAFGHLVLSRLEWEHVFFALTDQRVIAISGLWSRRIKTIALADIVWFELRPLGEELGTIRIRGREPQQRMSVTCVEHPRQLTGILEEVLSANGIDITGRNE